MKISLTDGHGRAWGEKQKQRKRPPGARKKGLGPANLRGLTDNPGGLQIWGDVMPCQVFESKNWNPEQILCAAVLEDALACLRGRWGKRDQEEAERWLRSRLTGYIYDFEEICLTLDLDAECIRAEVLKDDEEAA